MFVLLPGMCCAVFAASPCLRDTQHQALPHTRHCYRQSLNPCRERCANQYIHVSLSEQKGHAQIQSELLFAESNRISVVMTMALHSIHSSPRSFTDQSKGPVPPLPANPDSTSTLRIARWNQTYRPFKPDGRTCRATAPAPRAGPVLCSARRPSLSQTAEQSAFKVTTICKRTYMMPLL